MKLLRLTKWTLPMRFASQYDEQDPFYGRIVVQKHGDRYLIQNTPALPLTQEEMDGVYNLPYTRKLAS